MSGISIDEEIAQQVVTLEDMETDVDEQNVVEQQNGFDGDVEVGLNNYLETVRNELKLQMEKIFQPCSIILTKDWLDNCETSNDKKRVNGKLKIIEKYIVKGIKSVLSSAKVVAFFEDCEELLRAANAEDIPTLIDSIENTKSMNMLVDDLCTKVNCNTNELEIEIEQDYDELKRACNLLQCNKTNLVEQIVELKFELQKLRDELTEASTNLDKLKIQTKGTVNKGKDCHNCLKIQKSAAMSHKELKSVPKLEESSQSYRGMFHSTSEKAVKVETERDMLLRIMTSQMLPDVKCFSNGNGQDFDVFVDAFNMKYPVEICAESVRKSIFFDKLKGTAKNKLDGLPEMIRYGKLEKIMDYMREELTCKSRQQVLQALSNFTGFNMKYKKGSPLVEFCKRLEEISRNAFPSESENTLSMLRGKALYDALESCSCAIHLLEILENEKEHEVYEKLKVVALRCERVQNSMRSRLPNSERSFHSSKPTLNRDENKMMFSNNYRKLNNDFKFKSENPNQRLQGRDSRDFACYLCKNKGHIAPQCPNRREEKARHLQFARDHTQVRKEIKQENSSGAIEAWSHAIISKDKNISDNMYGVLSYNRMRLCETVERSVLIDTGSQISFISSGSLKNFMDEGVDVDSKIEILKWKDPENIADASGNKMSFVGSVRLKVLCIENGRDADIIFLVKKSKEHKILLGTNAFKQLGIQLRFISKQARILERTFIPPHQCQWVTVSCDEDKDSMLWSKREEVNSGVFPVNKDYSSQILVSNISQEPLILKSGEIMGEWDDINKAHDHTKLVKVNEIKMLDQYAKPTDVESRCEQVIEELEKQSSRNFPESVVILLSKYSSIFALCDADLTQTNTILMEIDTGSTLPIRQKVRPVPFGAKAAFRDMLNDLLTRGIIERSKSAWASPIVLVEKKDKSIRLCIDYRELNKIIKLDAYPLPTIDILLRSLKGKRFFSTFDLASGFWQIKLSEEAKEKTAFTTSEGLFQFLVCPFGLATSPPTFQRMMDCVLGNLLNSNEVFVYIDDILVATDTLERHLELLDKVFTALQKANLSLKAAKCKILQESVAYLGHKIDANGIHTDPDKVEKIKNFKRPNTIAELRSFLGLASYYRKFILKFASIAKPLHNMTSEKTKWEWTREREEAFEQLKEVLQKSPVLVQPDVEGAFDGSNPYIIYTDACATGVGAVICQKGKDTFLHPIAFSSKGLTKAQGNYHVTDLEAYAVVFALEKFHQYIYNMKNTVVRTDHQPLMCLFKKNVSGRLLRWSMTVQSYNIKLEFVKGKGNVIADALSRGIERENISQEEVIESRLVCSVEITVGNITELIADDPKYEQIINHLENNEFDVAIKFPRMGRTVYSGEFLVERDVLYLVDKEGDLKKVIPKSQRRKLYEELHESNFGAHFGVKKILAKIRKVAFWESMTYDVARWYRECKKCFLTNQANTSFQPPLVPIRSTKPFEIVGIDVMELGLTSQGNKYVVAVIDHFTKWLGAYAVPDKSAKTIADVILMRWICEGGRWPQQFLSDQGTEFLNRIIKEIREVTKIGWIHTMGYNPRENGITERVNQTIQKALKKNRNDTK